MPSEVREISGLIALVSTTLIGITIFLLRVAWRGLANSYFKLTPPERREVGCITWWMTLFALIILFVMSAVGVYNPQLVPGATIFTIFLIEVVVLIISLGSWSIRRIRKIKKEPSKKPDELSLFYCLSFSFLSWSIFYNIFALIGISAIMLDIQITPNWLDNYNWGGWSLLDGIFLFVIGLPTLGYTHLKANWPLKSDSK